VGNPNVLFDKQKFATHLRDNALPPYGIGKCATYVREALEAAGQKTVGHPLSAKDYGPSLVSWLFAKTDSSAVPEIGDIAVFQGAEGYPHGHIQGWDGKNWISDFIQEDFYPARKFKALNPDYATYRK
jgi:hypothetical protein